MKNLFILLLVLSFNSFSSISVISDLDDTIKITNSGDEIDSAMNGAFSDKVFTGMPEFLASVRTYSNELHVLSASPLILRGKITSTLKKRKIEADSVILKNALAGESKLDFKVREMKKLFEKNSDDFILIGDDVGQDPEAYDEILRQYPNRVLAIYIHVVKNRQIPSSGFRYWTSFDLFMFEFVSGRLGSEGMRTAVNVMLSEKDFFNIIPSFANCPSTTSVWSWQFTTLFGPDAEKISQRLSDNCVQRGSSNLAQQ